MVPLELSRAAAEVGPQSLKPEAVSKVRSGLLLEVRSGFASFVEVNHLSNSGKNMLLVGSIDLPNDEIGDDEDGSPADSCCRLRNAARK
jgi:hypothetical protein